MKISDFITEGPRQDRVAQLFTEYRELLDTQGPTAFRKAVIQALSQEFNTSIASASNLYNAHMKTAGVSGLSKAERREKEGRAPVAAWGSKKRDMEQVSNTPAPTEMSTDDEDALIKGIIADCDSLGGIDNPDGYVDEDDIEWECTKIGDDVTIEWTLQFNYSSAVEALEENKIEILGANTKLANMMTKYRSRVIKFSPATLAKAESMDAQYTGKPTNTRRLRGSLTLKLI